MVTSARSSSCRDPLNTQFKWSKPKIHFMQKVFVNLVLQCFFGQLPLNWIVDYNGNSAKSKTSNH